MEKTIDISKIPVLWTTCDKSKNRHQPMEDMLEGLGIPSNKISGPITTPYTIGVAHGYLDAISRFKPPFLILEDDATLVREMESTIFSCPTDADSLYLGTSMYGRLEGRTVFNGVLATTTSNPAVNSVYNMLSMHAIVYLSDRYKNHIMDLLQSHIDNPTGGVDDPIAESMSDYNVYAVADPVFYQADGHSDHATKNRVPVKI